MARGASNLGIDLLYDVSYSRFLYYVHFAMSFQPYPVGEGCCNYDYEDVSIADGAVDGSNSLKLNGPTQPNEFNRYRTLIGELDFREV